MKNILFFIYLLYFTVLPGKAIIQEGHVNSYYKASETSLFDYSKITDLVVFGDSYSTTTTNYEDMTYTGKNESGGKDWPLILISLHDMYLWNFAMGGAYMSDKFDKKKNKHPCPLDTQYDLFKSKMSKGKEFGNWEGESTIFAFWFGINDILKTFWPRNETINESLSHLINVMNGSYEEGARNYLFFNIPPFDKSPQVIKGGYRDIPIFIEEFNEGIQSKVNEFGKAHPEANVILYNTYDELYYIYVNHEKFNITDVEQEYVSHPNEDPEKFYWNNSNHPGENVHRYFTEDLHNYLNSISINKVSVSTSSIRANSHLVNSHSIKKFNNELNHSLLPLIVFLFFLIFF